MSHFLQFFCFFRINVVMPNKPNQEYIETQRVIVGKRRAVHSLFLIFASLGILIVAGLIFSPLLGLNYLSSLFNSSSDIARTYYAVVVDTDTLDVEQSTEIASKLRVRGAAGVLVRSEESYKVILALYNTEKAATSVASQNISLDVDPEVMPLTIKKLTASGLSAEESNFFRNCFDFIIDTVDALYQLSYQLDLGNTSELSANMQLNRLALNAEYYNRELFTYDKAEFTALHNVMSSANSILRYVADESVLTSTVLPYSSDIKRCMARIAMLLAEG